MSWISHQNKQETYAYDLISLGEIMMRLDPGETRIHTARCFTVWEGGGEYNVARGLRRCFGLKTAIVTALVDNAVGRLLEDLILQGGVAPDYIQWRADDGIGRSVRNGLNFTERGFGLRGALGVPDRGNSAASQLRSGDVDWETIFAKDKTAWFHTGGIFAALSETTPGVVKEAMKAAKRNGTMVSYDLNYRPSLWKSHGGKAAAAVVNRELMPYVDLLIGNEEDFEASLGISISESQKNNSFSDLDKQAYRDLLREVRKRYPTVRGTAVTLRTVKTASVNHWDALLEIDGEIYQTSPMSNLAIFDRVGGGDSFAAGLIYGLLKGNEPELALKYGLVHGALAMTTPGDTSMARLEEIERILAGQGARVIR
jgi:2-dehydro-3-deoxygluconokinase